MATIPAYVHTHTHTQKLFVTFEEISENKYISFNNYTYIHIMGFPHDSAGKESTCNAGDLGSIPGLGRSPGKGKGYLSLLEWSSILAWRIQSVGQNLDIQSQRVRHD